MSLSRLADNCPACSEGREHTLGEWLLYHPFHPRAVPPPSSALIAARVRIEDSSE